MLRRLSDWLDLREGEGARTARLFSFIFTMTAAVVLSRSAQRELFLTAYPRSAIPDAFLWSSFALMGASLAVSALAERLSMVQLVRALLAFAAVAFAALFFFARQPMVVFVAVEVLTSLLLGQAWAVVTEALDVRAAKRLLPLIGVGAGLAWTLGGLAVGPLAKWLGPASPLLVAAAALGTTLGLLEVVAKVDVTPAPRRAKAMGFVAGLVSGLRYIATEPLTRVLAALITIELIVEKVTDFQLFASAQQRFAGQSGELAAFMGLFFGVTGAISLVSPLVSGRVLSAFGSTRALVAGQLWVLVGSVLFFFFPAFGVVVLLTGGDRVLKQGLTSPARSQVFGALPATRRSQAGALLRGVLAAFFSALAALGLKALPATLPVQWLSLGAVALLAVLLVLTSLSLRKAYLHALQRSVDKSRLDLDTPDAKRPLYREQLAMLEAELASGDEQRGALAVSVLGAGELEAVRPLLRRALEHPRPAVRALAVTTLGKAIAADVVAERGAAPADESSGEQSRVVLALERARGDARGHRALQEDLAALEQALRRATEDEVVVACLEALANLNARSALPLIAGLCDAPSVQVRALARVCRARILEGSVPVDESALGDVVAMLGSSHAAEREAAASAIGRVALHTRSLRARFTPLLADASPDVRRAALGAAAQFADESILKQVVAALDEPATSPVAFEALTRLDDSGVTGVEKVLDGAHPELLTRAAAALAQGRGQKANEVLQRWLAHAAPQVRYRASRALVQRRRTAGWRPPEESSLVGFIETELALGYRYQAALAALAKEAGEGDAALRFVAGELESRAQETERRLLALVGMVADPRLARLSHHLRDASPQVTARVLELIEQSLDARLSALLVPFLERTDAAQKAERGVERFRVPRELLGDPLEALLALGDEHLRLVAHVAFRERWAGRLPALTNEEEALVQLVERVRFLRSVPVFRNLSPEDLMKLAEIATAATYAEGQVIFRKGDPGDVLCVMVSGRVEIRNDGRVIATQQANDFFGELALFDQEPRSADAVCVADTVLLEIGGADLEALMERRPEISREIIRVLARRLRHTTQELVERTRS
ncbi:MAG: cyclic nucleotide-binding domain-containing protein [Myxococcota bacterium]